jgi:hypothetical protein
MATITQEEIRDLLAGFTINAPLTAVSVAAELFNNAGIKTLTKDAFEPVINGIDKTALANATTDADAVNLILGEQTIVAAINAAATAAATAAAAPADTFAKKIGVTEDDKDDFAKTTHDLYLAAQLDRAGFSLSDGIAAGLNKTAKFYYGITTPNAYDDAVKLGAATSDKVGDDTMCMFTKNPNLMTVNAKVLNKRFGANTATRQLGKRQPTDSPDIVELINGIDVLLAKYEDESVVPTDAFNETNDLFETKLPIGAIGNSFTKNLVQGARIVLRMRYLYDIQLATASTKSVSGFGKLLFINNNTTVSIMKIVIKDNIIQASSTGEGKKLKTILDTLLNITSTYSNVSDKKGGKSTRRMRKMGSSKKPRSIKKKGSGSSRKNRSYPKRK